METTMLVYHGRNKDTCEWVIKMFKNDPLTKDNLTTQAWIKACEDYLESIGDSPSW